MANGDLVYSKEPRAIKRMGKTYVEHVVGRISGNAYRILCDNDGGFVELHDYVIINKAYKVSMAALGHGVFDTYISAKDHAEAIKNTDLFFQGKIVDVVGRYIKHLPWASKPKVEEILLLGVTPADPKDAKAHFDAKIKALIKPAAKEKAVKVTKEKVVKVEKVKKVKEPKVAAKPQAKVVKKEDLVAPMMFLEDIF